MTKEKYIAMCEALQDPIIESDMPPDIDDFPSYVHIALDVFNCLPDTYSGGMDPIYSGKDIGAISALYDVMDVDDKTDKVRILKVVQFLDSRARKRAISEAKKRARKK